MDAGDGDDVVQGDGSLTGGSGRDTLEGGRMHDNLFGGPGTDVLRGGDDGLDGDGTFGEVDLGGSDNLLDGGDGTDAVTFAQRATPVGVDLAAGTAGGDVERDALVSIEDAVGGAGADTLLGDGLANTLAGGGGNDQLAAGGGDDVLYGRAGIDRLDGGEGDDHLEVTDEGHVAIGGAGADRLDGQTGTRLMAATVTTYSGSSGPRRRSSAARGSMRSEVTRSPTPAWTAASRSSSAPSAS